MSKAASPSKSGVKSSTAPAQSAPAKPFLTDIKTLRERARKHIMDGAVTVRPIGPIAARSSSF